jgi:hypothetical protein
MARNGGGAAIRTEGLRKSYGSVRALDGVDLARRPRHGVRPARAERRGKTTCVRAGQYAAVDENRSGFENLEQVARTLRALRCRRSAGEDLLGRHAAPLAGRTVAVVVTNWFQLVVMLRVSYLVGFAFSWLSAVVAMGVKTVTPRAGWDDPRGATNIS